MAYPGYLRNLFQSEKKAFAKFWSLMDHFHRESMGNQWNWPFELFQYFFCKILHFVIDMHQIMLISLFPTPFDHFYFHPTLGLKWTHKLRLCHICFIYVCVLILIIATHWLLVFPRDTPEVAAVNVPYRPLAPHDTIPGTSNIIVIVITSPSGIVGWNFPSVSMKTLMN